MIALALVALMQQGAAPAPQATRLEVTPTEATAQVGGTVQLRARVLDAAGNVVPNAQVLWFTGGGEGSVSDQGLVTAGYPGKVQVTAVTQKAGGGQVVAQAVVRVLPAPPARVAIAPAVARLIAGTRMSLVGTAYSAQGDVRYDPVRFASSNSAVIAVTPEGALQAVAPGTATLTATVGEVRSTQQVQVLPAAGVQLSITPAGQAVRTGDVVSFTAQPRNASGALTNVTVVWSLLAGEGQAKIDAEGRFVAEAPGRYTVSARAGTAEALAVIDASPRGVARAFEVLGRVPVNFRSAEVWVHQGGQCAYLSTIADRVYAIDVSNPSAPRIVDSMITDAQIVNDVMTTEDGKWGVFSREGASTRANGIVIFDASDPCHPKPVSEYTETVPGGVHSSYVYQGRVYLTDDATGSIRVIDIRDPMQPREVGRWDAPQTPAGRYVHDVMVVDGLAYLSYWNDGLIILDVGNGAKGGTPERPVMVSQYKYDLDRLYRRIDEMYGLGPRGTHTAWRHGKYVFIGDEVYAARTATGLEEGNNLTFGRLQVLDVSNIEAPKLVAWYEPTDGGVHNIWVEGDTLYMGAYQGGARALDISGELRGDLLAQGRELAWLFTADNKGNLPRATFSWGAVVKNGIVFVPDINTGLWIMKMEPKRTGNVVP
jgi:hypothetical protein